MRKHYLLVSDFDQTLSFNDSGHVMSDMLGIRDFAERVAGLSRLNLVQSGAELTYLILHDPEFRRVRRDDLVEVGRRIRLKRNISLLSSLAGDAGSTATASTSTSSPPRRRTSCISALDGIVPPERIIATRFVYDRATAARCRSIARVPAGYGKVAAVDELRDRLGVPGDRIVYVGDGSSDIHVMLHVNRCDGLTIAASEARFIARIAQRTVMSDDAMSVSVPVLEDIVGYDRLQIRTLFEQHGVLIQEWDRVRTDWLTIVGEADRALA